MFRKNIQKYLECGLLLIYKESGKTSHDVVQEVIRAAKHIGFSVKAGHSGTLDPKVTGLLVVGLGRGTKVLEFMLESEKVYIGELVLHQAVSREVLEKVLQTFTGTITQLPPQKSSVKRVLRDRTVYRLSIMEYTPRRVMLYCAVEKGTYIRKLFHDIGQALGTGAHMGELHRTSVGPFKNPAMITTTDFEKLLRKSVSYNPFSAIPAYLQLQKYLVPTDRAFPNIPRVYVQETVGKYILAGSDLFLPGTQSIPKHVRVGERVLVYEKSTLLAVGELCMSYQESLAQEKGVVVKLNKVLGK